MQKCLVSFPKARQDFEAASDDPASYFDYLLELADRLFRGRSDHEDDRAR